MTPLQYLLIATLSFAFACGDDDTMTTDVGADTSVADTGVSDTNVAMDASDTSVSDTSVVDTMTGGDAGMETALTATFGEETAGFDLAYFGRNLDGTLRMEIFGDPIERECPVMDTPFPAHTLVLGSIDPPTDSAVSPRAAVLIEVRGMLLGGEPLVRFESGTLLPITWSLTGAESDYLTIQLDLVFPGGTVTGRATATHCTSLDEPS